MTGRSQHRVLSIIERGAPVRHQPKTRGGDWIFSLNDLIRWAFDEMEKGRVPTAESPDAIDFNAERARLTREQADKLELENAETRRVMVRSAPIAAGLAAQDQSIKDRLLMVPLSAAAEALAEGKRAGEPGISEVYERYINRALADLASADLVPVAAH